MKLVTAAVLLCWLPGLMSAAEGSAQQSPPAAGDDQTRIILEVTRVNLLFTVTDRRGRFVTGLTKDDFIVREGKNPQKILEFTAESDLPLRLVVLVDTSNSVRDRFRFIQEAAIEFLNSVLRPGQDKAAVISFDTAPELQADLTDNLELLTSKIRELRPGGGTSLYDAIFYAARDKLMQDQPLHKFRRAMIILSDGEDNQSRFSRDQALEMAQKADVVIYTISTSSVQGGVSDTRGDRILKYFSEETGGATFFPFRVTDLSQSFENIANELRHQYNILYRPEPLKTDGSYQSVEVRVQGRNNLVVRARKGYYAPRL
ncbi:MAG: VWA domain-containing protein [Bryobacteraceae bacterium]